MSNASSHIDSMKVLTYCDSWYNRFTHQHCSVYSQGVFHQVDVVRMTDASDTVDCLCTVINRWDMPAPKSKFSHTSVPLAPL